MFWDVEPVLFGCSRSYAALCLKHAVCIRYDFLLRAQHPQTQSILHARTYDADACYPHPRGTGTRRKAYHHHTN